MRDVQTLGRWHERWRYENAEDPAGSNPRANALKETSGMDMWENMEFDFNNAYLNREFPEVPASMVNDTSWTVERFQPVFTYEAIHITEMRGFF